MQASEVIARLQELIAKHGDREVQFVDNEYGPTSFEHVVPGEQTVFNTTSIILQ